MAPFSLLRRTTVARNISKTTTKSGKLILKIRTIASKCN
jgi:hypothetical protein